MNSGSGPQSRRSFGGSRTLPLLTVVLLAGLFCLRLPLLKNRYFDPDELVHTQIAFLLSQGWVPHQDFFEHHNLLFHFILIPMIDSADPPGTLFAARILMFILVGGIVTLTYLLGRILAGPLVGGLASIGLLSNYVFLVKSQEIRPAGLTIIWLLLALLLFVSAIRNGRKALWFWGGLAAALSLATTQKTIFLLLGMAGFLAVFWFRNARRDHNHYQSIWRQIAGAGLGLALGAILYLLYFLRSESLAGMIRETIFLNLRWGYRFSPWNYARQFLFFNPAFVFWAAAGIVSAPILARRRPDRKDAILLTGSTLAGGIAGAVIIPVPYAQYFSLFTPLAYIFAALAVVEFLTFLWNSGFKIRARAGLVLILPVLAPLYLQHVTDYRYYPQLEEPGFWFGFSAAALLLGYLFTLITTRKFGRWAAGFALLAAVIVRPVNLIIHSYRQTNHHYLKLLDTIHHLTTVEDRVFDGFSGLGLFRLPAYYYYYLPGEILNTLNPQLKGPELLSALEAHPPAVIVNDDPYRQIPKMIYSFIENNYYLLTETSLRGIPTRIYLRNP